MTPTDPGGEAPAEFLNDCVFFHGSMEGRGAGWYIELRSGHTYGPFPDKDVAQTILNGVVARLKAKEFEESGNRHRDTG